MISELSLHTQAWYFVIFSDALPDFRFTSKASLEPHWYIWRWIPLGSQISIPLLARYARRRLRYLLQLGDAILLASDYATRNSMPSLSCYLQAALIFSKLTPQSHKNASLRLQASSRAYILRYISSRWVVSRFDCAWDSLASLSHQHTEAFILHWIRIILFLAYRLFRELIHYTRFQGRWAQVILVQGILAQKCAGLMFKPLVKSFDKMIECH